SRDSLANLSSYDSLHVVVGNESCDLDSAVSSIVYAYLLYLNSNKNNDTKTLFFPILNTNRKDLQLKSELIFWLKDTIQLNLDFVIVKEDVNSILKHSGKKILITLVDHNKNEEFEELGEIVEIIDHHQDLVVNHRSNTKLEIDSHIGSCTTLIAKRYLNYCEENNQKADIQVVLMLYGPIVLDTVCFSTSAQRFCEEDLNIAQKIEHILGPASLTREEVFQQLTKAKNSLSELNVEQILRKDLKVIEGSDSKNFVISSVSGHLVSDIFSEDKFSSSLISFIENNHYVGICVMGIKSDEKLTKRELAICTISDVLFEKICQKLQDPSSNLQLKVLWSRKNVILWEQGNVTASRKIVLPLISMIMNDYDSIESKANDSMVNSSAEESKTPEFTRRKLPTQVSTADVDPEFLENYQAETVDFPESPQALINEIVPESGASADRKGKKINSSNFVASEMLIKNACSNIVKSCVNNPSTRKAAPSPSHQVPPVESINYYESYFMDSFVGEFSGEVDVEKVKDSEDIWCNDSSMDGFNSELSFDSFGPESLIFSSHLENVNESSEPVPNGIQNFSNDSDLQSLSVTEPQLGDKVRLCFDESKIKTGYELTIEDATPSERQDEPSAASGGSEENTKLGSSFLRNGPLTQSQRRKISPKLKFEEILNSSDDANTPTGELPDVPFNMNTINKVDSENTYENNSRTLVSEDSLNSQIDSFKGSHMRQNSTAKKKISVNREFLESEDMSNDLQENEKRKVSFFPSEGFQSKTPERIAELTVSEEIEETRYWRPSCPMGVRGEIKRIDMKVIEPYKKVLSHGGYYHHYNTVQLRKSTVPAPTPAVIIFSACYLPDRSRRDYDYVMDNLFMYVLTTLHELVADDYILIYFHNAGGSGISSNNMPTFSWLKRCYYMIDRKLRKNLKSLFLVHPTFWLKTLVIMTKPFIRYHQALLINLNTEQILYFSSKFARKLQFVNTLSELNDLVPIDSTIIPPPVKQ
ncbi:protein prune 2-like isoform X2, partial [Dinothrombium tinctorium]